METTKIAELAKILKDNGLTKLDLTEGDNRLVLEAVSAPVAPAVGCLRLFLWKPCPLQQQKHLRHLQHPLRLKKICMNRKHLW